MNIDKLISESLNRQAENFSIDAQKRHSMLDYIEKQTEMNKEELPASDIDKFTPFTQRFYNAVSAIPKLIKLKDSRNLSYRFILSHYFTEFIQVAAVIAVLAMVPVLTLNYKDKFSKAPDNHIEQNTNNTAPEVTPYGSRLYVTITDTAIYRNTDKNSEQIRKLKAGDLVLVKKTESGADNNYWHHAADLLSSSTEQEGWIPDSHIRRYLALTRIEESSIRNEDIKVLMGDYFKSLSQVGVPEDRRLKDYRVSNVTFNSIEYLEYNIRVVSATVEYDVKPGNIKAYRGEGSGTTDSEGWIKRLYSSATIEIIENKPTRGEDYSGQRLCILTNVLSEPGLREGYKAEQPAGIAIANMLDKHGFIDTANSRVTGKVQLPNKLSSFNSDKSNLAAYLAYSLEISKGQGFDFSQYLGKTVDIISSKAVKKENMRDNYNYVALLYQGKICGAWLEKIDYSNPPTAAITTFDGRNLSSAIRDRTKWIKDNELTIKEDSIESIVSENIVAFRNPLIYKITQMDIPVTEDQKAMQRAVYSTKDQDYINYSLEVEIIEKRTQDEIARSLADAYLKQFKNDKLTVTRISDYTIDNIAVSSSTGILGYAANMIKDLNLKENEFIFHMTYSVKPADSDNLINWAPGNGVFGEQDKKGWMLGKSCFMKVTKVGNIYKLGIMGTGL